MLVDAGVTITIVDDDTDEFYGIVFPASIDRQESTDVNIYAITNQQDIVTDICGNLDVCPYDRRLPPLHSTPLICEASSQSYGQRHKIPKPTRQSRDRFGSYVISAAYDPEQRIPVFVLRSVLSHFTDSLKPLFGPTITINNKEDVVIGVGFSRYTNELRWKFNGKGLKKYSGKCYFEIKRASFGKHDGYYEVFRNQRGDSGYRTIIRLIIRRCPEGSFIADGICTKGTFRCYNGGVLGEVFPANDWKCICPLGFYGQQCETVYTGNLRIGPPGKGLTCKDLGDGIPRDCRGALFCFADPLGCLCARGYWGPKCDRVCPPGRFGWSCLQKCHCRGSWIPCDSKTGVCGEGTANFCDDDYEGPNCQQLIN
ncbi:putative angiopoietin-1 receptor-like [Apostichopus japonicus]|uniref:Putative angiopoietin-1 receptor-like n=1 Tax=Stichopus japonicus TaxID=307972 RepID=A0A2G8KYU5_STIJA|nr:putative angiopoietin-1 receptor-like [Apostichopus japonicus]